jgi:glycosyltransferase involved in cell wall biosynthesis
MYLHIFGPDTAYGMRHDAAVLLRAARTAGLRADASLARFTNARQKLRREVLHRLGRRPYDVNLALEQTIGRFEPYARLNTIVPNQEWCRPETVEALGRMDCVLCKTRHAVEIFDALGHRTAYIGFSTPDCRTDGMAKAPLTFLHVAGRSFWKGTGAVIEAWRRRPDWPELTIVAQQRWPQAEGLRNVRLINEYIPEDAMTRLMNQTEIHVRPTEMEGYGHNIVEAMACGGIVVTTDGPPMNELVTPERGVLVGVERQEPHHLGTRFFADVDDLTAQIDRVIAMPAGERRAMGQAARAWYEENDRQFPARLKAAIDSL